LTVGSSVRSSPTGVCQPVAVRRDVVAHVLPGQVGGDVDRHFAGEREVRVGGPLERHLVPDVLHAVAVGRSPRETVLFGTVTIRPEGWFASTRSPSISQISVTKKWMDTTSRACTRRRCGRATR
jgi:hypothetical protein